jgi:hypothetical protein
VANQPRSLGTDLRCVSLCPGGGWSAAGWENHRTNHRKMGIEPGKMVILYDCMGFLGLETSDFDDLLIYNSYFGPWPCGMYGCNVDVIYTYLSWVSFSWSITSGCPVSNGRFRPWRPFLETAWCRSSGFTAGFDDLWPMDNSIRSTHPSTDGQQSMFTGITIPII